MTQEENDYTLCPHTAVGVAFHYSVPPTIPRVNLFASLIYVVFLCALHAHQYKCIVTPAFKHLKHHIQLTTGCKFCVVIDFYLFIFPRFYVSFIFSKFLYFLVPLPVRNYATSRAKYFLKFPRKN